MRRLHFTITAALAIAVVILTVLLVREGRPGGDPTPTAPIPPGRRIERVPDAELALKRLGYAAWVFRWSGGMIDGELSPGPGLPPRGLDGGPLSHDLRAFAKAGGGTAPRLDSMSGMVVVLVGPLPRAAQPPTVPCRVVLYGESGSASGSREGAGPLQVAFAEVAAEGELSVEVFGRWREHPGGAVSPDPDSKYPLIQLRWLADSGTE